MVNMLTLAKVVFVLGIVGFIALYWIKKRVMQIIMGIISAALLLGSLFLMYFVLKGLL